MQNINGCNQYRFVSGWLYSPEIQYSLLVASDSINPFICEILSHLIHGARALLTSFALRLPSMMKKSSIDLCLPSSSLPFCNGGIIFGMATNETHYLLVSGGFYSLLPASSFSLNQNHILHQRKYMWTDVCERKNTERLGFDWCVCQVVQILIDNGIRPVLLVV